jgi:hypothetical protein
VFILSAALASTVATAAGTATGLLQLKGGNHIVYNSICCVDELNSCVDALKANVGCKPAARRCPG